MPDDVEGRISIHNLRNMLDVIRIRELDEIKDFCEQKKNNLADVCNSFRIFMSTRENRKINPDLVKENIEKLVKETEGLQQWYDVVVKI